MEIYVVKQGDDIESIAEEYKISVEKLIESNGLQKPQDLVVGQTLVIAYPKQSHIVQPGDTLDGIAEFYSVTEMQLLRNNPFLSDREVIYPGESLVISYDTKRKITVSGFTYPFIKTRTLIKTLPNLTYLSIFNYTTTKKGEIYEYEDETEIIQTAKEYGTIPLLLLGTLTPQGKSDVELAYTILLSEVYQERNINQFVEIMKSKGYEGVNIIFNYLNEDNQVLYQKFVEKVSGRMRKEGFLFFVTFNYKEQMTSEQLTVPQIDYAAMNQYVDGFVFLKFAWASDYGPPAPVSSITRIRELLDYVSGNMALDSVVVGQPMIAYDWKLPYIPNQTGATSLSLDSVINLAGEVGAVIQFDEISQTPFFLYTQYDIGLPYEHIVWFVDARSIDALNKLIIESESNGIGIWSTMIYNAQLWTIINATFDVEKLT